MEEYISPPEKRPCLHCKRPIEEGGMWNRRYCHNRCKAKAEALRKRKKYHTNPEYRARELERSKRMTEAQRAHKLQYGKEWRIRKKEKESCLEEVSIHKKTE